MDAAVKEFDFLKNMWVGASVLGRLDGESIGMILAGMYDTELKCLVWGREISMEVKPDCAENLNVPVVVEKLERIKDHFRAMIQRAINAEEKILEHERAEQLRKAEQAFRNMNKPSELGTVAELAAKYGKSKSEIRRLKAANLLNTLEIF